MRMSRLLLATSAFVALAFPSPARAQGQAQQALPDSVQAALVDVLEELRDTAMAVRGQLAVFGRDLGQAGAETVVSRAAALTARCEAASETLRAVEPTVRPGAGWPSSARAASAELIGAMRALRETLRTECQLGLGPEGPGVRADSLRAWGPYRAGVLQRATAEFDSALGRVARALGIRLEPRIP